LQGDKFINWTIFRIELHNDRYRISSSKHNHATIGVNVTSGDGWNCKRDIVIELAPFPVTFIVDGKGETMVIGSGNEVLRCRVTGNDNLVILLIIDDARDFFILYTTNGHWE
jgi:hypothetical protein